MPYKIKQEALAKVNNIPGRIALCIALEQGEDSIKRLIASNVPNGNLTKAAAVESISKTTGMTREAILENIPE